MRLKMGLLILVIGGVFAFASCGGGGGSDEEDENGDGFDTCQVLCKNEDYDDGELFENETDKVWECTCSGDGKELEQLTCDQFCALYDDSADVYVSDEGDGIKNKCVCDGTGGL